ncbi:hypothetical protein IW262DRAFT_305982 [Armillaria fumosa]|nr:hypothetical protein IW262DRAFT_305982 [Armillaria fumosa]
MFAFLMHGGQKICTGSLEAPLVRVGRKFPRPRAQPRRFYCVNVDYSTSLRQDAGLFFVIGLVFQISLRSNLAGAYNMARTGMVTCTLRLRLEIFGRLTFGLGSAAHGDIGLMSLFSLASYDDDNTTETHCPNQTLFSIYVGSDHVTLDN